MPLSPFPPAPIPGSESFEVDAGKVLDAIPTLVDELNALQNDVSAKQVAAAGSANAADVSEAAAAVSAVAAAASETAAAASASAAATSRTEASNAAGASAASATASAASASAAEGSAAQALAIYGNTEAMQTAVAQAAAQASVAAGHAASASSVVQQDLSGVNAAALHRSPNAVTAIFVYDTSKDSDGGAWTEKCQHTSWYNEPLNGKWLGAQATEAAARAVSGATTGDYFQLTTNGKFYKLNDTSGTTEVFRGNKADFPRLAAIVADGSGATQSVVIYDLTEPGRPMWMRFNAASGNSLLLYMASTPGVVALEGRLIVPGASTGLMLVDFPADSVRKYGSNNTYTRWTGVGLAERNGKGWAAGTGPLLSSVNLYAVAATVLPGAPVNPTTGLRVPTVAVATGARINLLRHDGTIVTSSVSTDYSQVTLTPTLLSAGRGDGVWYYATTPGALGAGFVLQTRSATQAPDFGAGNTARLLAASRGRVVRASATAGTVQLLRHCESDPSKGLAATITGTYNTGYQLGDIRRTYLSDIEAGGVSSPASVPDRSYKAASAAVTGTLTRAPVATAAQLVATSGFSAGNYLREPYSADLDFGTGDWSVSAWINIPSANATAGVIASRAHASGAYITLGIDATNKLTATAHDGTASRTVTSTTSYNTSTWIKARAIYQAGRLALLVDGQEVAATHGTPLLTLNNAAAVLTIGNSYALDAPFPGFIALLKLSATVPTPEQSIWMYEQEKQLFRAGAPCCLPDAGAIVDLAYDDATDKWIAVSAANEVEWAGLVRAGVTAVPAGSYTKVAAVSGVQLLARSTTSPGVDVTLPAYGLRQELVRRAEAAARLNAQPTAFDYVGGFTATTTSGSTSLTSVAGLTYPSSYIGAQVAGAGIQAGTVITGVSGTTLYLSAAATATATGVQISFTDFILPVGYEAKAVLSAGALKQEGATKDYTRQFDGFKEAIRFGVAPGYQAWVQINATRSAA